MSLVEHRALFARVPVWFWPGLALQLWRLQSWAERSGRDVLFYVDRFGRVRVTAVGPDPLSPQPWQPGQYIPLIAPDRRHSAALTAPFAMPGSAIVRAFCFQRLALMRGASSARMGAASLDIFAAPLCGKTLSMPAGPQPGRGPPA